MQLKQIVLALCLSSFAVALPENHQRDGRAVEGADQAGGTGTAAHDHKTGGKGDKGHNKNGTSEEFECAEITKLTKLTALVNNATALSELETKHNLTDAEITKIKDSAANATTKLTTLQSNTTLVAQCAIVDAHAQLEKQCKEINKLAKLIAFANNATAISEITEKKNLTATEVAKLKEGAANATTKLTKLQSNTTLVAACATLKTERGSNSTGAATTTTSSSAAISIRSMDSAGQILANVIFAAAMGGMALSLMA